MKRKGWLIFVSIVIIIPNLPVIGTGIMDKIDSDHFRYSNNDASFTQVEDFDIKRPWMNEWVVWGFIERTRPEARNMEVFRLYKINPLCFWRWRYYILVSRKFRYKNWERIERDRVPFIPNNMWQDF